jgi:aryl-alcohol dehydrogenase-like predicted oxidoreductase
MTNQGTGNKYIISHGLIYELFADATVSQVAIAWLLHRPSVASVVIGARTLEQLEENLQSVNLHLSKEEVCVL